VDVPGDIGAAWGVLSDYNRLAEFVPDMQVSRVVSRPGEPIRVYQRGAKSWLLLDMPLELVFQMEETPASRIRFRMLSGNIENMFGEWRIAAHGSWVRVTYLAHMKPGLLSPRVPGDYLLIEEDIETMMKAIGQEILRRKTVASRP
jgi:hypothetical protein